MIKELLEILRCPICNGSLILSPVLDCENCGVSFPVVDDIIVLLTPEKLQGFLKEPWGEELVKEKFGAFVHSDDVLGGLQKIVDRAKSEAISKHKDYGNSGYDRPKDFDGAISRSIELLAEKSHVKTAKRILDWPTGGGSFLNYLVDIVPSTSQIVATDINFGQLATTKAYLNQTGRGKNILFVVCDARFMPFRDNAFQGVTAWGGTVEIPSSNLAVRESYRVLESGGWFGISGDLYKEDSESFKMAKKLGLDSLATRTRLEKCLEKTGFNNLSYNVLYEGFDVDISTPPEERCPLPAPGDWFSHVVATGQRI